MTALLRVENVAMHIRKPQFRYLLQDIKLELQAGESVGITGTSGSGKSTLARILMALIPPSSGKIFYRDQEQSQFWQKRWWGPKRFRPVAPYYLRYRVQMIFQDPALSLNPLLPVLTSLSEPLWAQNQQQNAEHKIKKALTQVGLAANSVVKYPHAFSGGQRQRLVIARALLSQPELIIADEPTSALDVAVQAQIMTLILALQQELGFALLLISHDLAVVHTLCQRVLRLEQGRLTTMSSPA